MSNVTPFPPRGLIFFWFLNTDCPRDQVSRQIRAFKEGVAGGLVLHPREGLLVPYASTDWFNLIRDIADEVSAAGIQPWLYDEDYCPSGQAGGRIIAEHPEYLARNIVRHEAPADLRDGELFIFPLGKLVWAGLVDADGNATELTEHVGTFRRHWEVSLTWDSRWYYPGVPLYNCPRSGSYVPEFSMRTPARQHGQRLVAFTAQPVGKDSCYLGLADPLDPAATQEFIDRVYVPYANVMGDRLGKSVPAMFTDEPKYHGGTPWTPALFDGFQKQFGYCLRTRLDDLFSQSLEPRAMLTRLHYRQWIGNRFDEAWLKPVAEWCKARKTYLVGHISPEDDPVQQTECVSNLIPLQKRFDLAGLDLIVPAVGDAKHGMLNLGALTGTTCAQQFNKPGVMSEVLGASGLDLTTAQGAKIIAWQMLSGVSSIVIHAAFLSRMGMRLYDAPPDCGPDSPRWAGMVQINRAILPIQDVITNSTQIAPVAVLWPIRSFNARPGRGFHEPDPLRNAFIEMLVALLEAQVGIHLLDEAELQTAKIGKGSFTIGRGKYSHVVIPESIILHEKTLDRLAEVQKAKIPVHLCGNAPKYVERRDRIQALPSTPWHDANLAGVSRDRMRDWCLANLPRLAPIATKNAPDVRATQWNKAGVVTTLVMNLGERSVQPCTGITLVPGEIVAMREQAGKWEVAHRFDTAGVAPNAAPPRTLSLKDWRCRFADQGEQKIAEPFAVYRLRPDFSKSERIVHMTLTGTSAVGGAPLADWLDYTARIDANGKAPRATLVLEPTIIRGKLTISVGDKQWNVTVNDVDTKPTMIDLSPGLAGGAREIRFRVDKPMPFDGLHVAPTILSE